MATLQENKYGWGNYKWPKDGDEWDDQAKHAKVPYSLWKQSLVSTFLSVEKNDRVVEIGVGHGRWASQLLGKCNYIGFDIVEQCILFCQQKWLEYAECFRLCDGLSLPFRGCIC